LFIERPKELFMPCIIKPLDDKEGLITAIRYDACKCMLQVRYFDFAGIRHDWFYDFELELKNLREKDKAFFRSY
jgi:hypothetical protein